MLPSQCPQNLFFHLLLFTTAMCLVLQDTRKVDNLSGKQYSLMLTRTNHIVEGTCLHLKQLQKNHCLCLVPEE